MDLDLTTHRAAFAELIPGQGYIFGQMLTRQGLRDSAIEGLEAIAALWFDEHEDEDTLPPLLVTVYDTIAAVLYLSSERFEQTLEDPS